MKRSCTRLCSLAMTTGRAAGCLYDFTNANRGYIHTHAVRASAGIANCATCGAAFDLLRAVLRSMQRNHNNNNRMF